MLLLLLPLQEELTNFLNDCIATAGANVGPNPALVSCRMQQDKNFAFIELRSAEEATNVMALDGVCLRGEIPLKVHCMFAGLLFCDVCCNALQHAGLLRWVTRQAPAACLLMCVACPARLGFHCQTTS